MSLLARIAEETGGTFRLVEPVVLGDDERVVVLYEETAERGNQTLDTRMVGVARVTDNKVSEYRVCADDGAAVEAFFS